MNCMCVWRVRIEDVNDAESPENFHNIQGRDPTRSSNQNHAHDERLTGRVSLKRRCNFSKSMDDEEEMLTARSCTLATGEEAWPQS